MREYEKAYAEFLDYKRTLLQGSLPSHFTRNERLLQCSVSIYTGFYSLHHVAYHPVHASLTGRAAAGFSTLVAIIKINERGE